jgi:hypothetical protein
LGNAGVDETSFIIKTPLVAALTTRFDIHIHCTEATSRHGEYLNEELTVVWESSLWETNWSNGK